MSNCLRKCLISFLLCTFVRQARQDTCLAPLWFRCNNGRCISYLFICDGADDCRDGTDEKDCKPSGNNSTLSVTLPCAEDEFRCENNECIPLEKFCDNINDCADSSDEYDGCVHDIKCNDFRCKDGHCIKHDWVCDGFNDCLDGSDEISCDTSTIFSSNCTNEFDHYLCNNRICIPLNKTCDGKNDCGDGSDENVEGCAKADQQCKNTTICSHHCRRTPAGHVCSCAVGYKLLNDHTCEDIDECAVYGICDQHCTNRDGSYSCVCRPGYTWLEEKKMCKADGGEALMVFSSKSEIRGFFLNTETYYSVMRNMRHVVGISVGADYIYWSDLQKGDETIFRSLEDGTDREVIVSTGLGSPQEIAVDWITNNVYFTDSLYKRIGVCNHRGSFCTVLISENVDKPEGLALVPSTGTMYWSDWGTSPHIYRMGMDGANNEPFISKDLGWPKGLTVDYANDRLYWVDVKSKVIESVLLDGKDRRTVLHDTAKHPFSLAVFENRLYWSDWSTNTIQSCDKFTGKDWRILVREPTQLYGIHIFHSVLKPKLRNPCEFKPCSQLCLLNEKKSYTCACTLDAELNDDQHTCRVIKNKEHLVIVAGNTFIDYYHEILGKPKMSASMLLKHISMVTYDSLSDTMIASDQISNSIFRFDMNTSDESILLSVKNELIGGMDFDFIGNNLYWSDIEHNTIAVHSLETNGTTLLHFHDTPLDIALTPENGAMLVVFRSEKSFYIKKVQMAMQGIASATATIVDNLLGPKVTVRYSRELQKVFWADQGSGCIESSSIDGNDRHLFRTGLSAPVSLAILGEIVFWTELGANRLYWANNRDVYQNNKHINVLVPENLEIMHLAARHPTPKNLHHDCRRNNGNCSHVCFPVDAQSFVCKCPPGMELAADQRTCTGVQGCAPDEFQCDEKNVCVKRSQKCDGVMDCPNGEDEKIGCAHSNASCAYDEFACKSGGCISSRKRCNSQYDCKDRSDEENCDEPVTCGANEFRCHEGGCVSKFVVCDGRKDCPDFTDELNCATHRCDHDSFVCESGRCVPKIWFCDGERDCEDGSDEPENCMRSTCSEHGLFICGNGRCLDPSLVCNTDDDCGDGSDELNCIDKYFEIFLACRKDEYRCAGTDICLHKAVRCNGVQDCAAGDDEHNCDICDDNEFTCDNQKCIRKSWVCDGTNDCGDKSDEKDCDGHFSSHFQNNGAESRCDEFTCSSGVCLSFEKVCDGINDCSDGSDEYGECGASCVKSNPCEHVCHKTPTGPVCSCQKGYSLGSDNTSCADIDECVSNVCLQICQNTAGSFVCSCRDGYVLRSDKKSCKAVGSPMKIMIAGKGDIRAMSSPSSNIEVIYREPNFDISGLDVNTHRGTVYWSNGELGTINMINLATSKRKTISGIGRPEVLTVDWVTDNVYFYDAQRPYSIKACNLMEQRCAKIVSVERSLVTVMSIAADPRRRRLFWSQTNWQTYDSPSSEIYQTDTTGSQRSAIVDKNLGVVSGLAIDYFRAHLYWTDTALRLIERSDFDGTNRQVFMKTNSYQPLTISIYEDALYWLMGNVGTLNKCNLQGDRRCSPISVGSSKINRHFVIFHVSRQPTATNVCENHNCKSLCVPKSPDYVCMCPNGYTMSKLNDTCAENANEKLNFVSSVAQLSENKSARPRDSSTITAIVITVLTCIIVATAYYYYNKGRFSRSKRNDLSIHFQNPAFGRRNDPQLSVNCMGTILTPGDHEYINPISSVSYKIDLQKGGQLNTSQACHLEPAECDMEDLTFRHDSRLIH